MNRFLRSCLCSALTAAALFCFGCKPKSDTARDSKHTHSHGHGHHHEPPHGGTAVVLGDETYHLEFVLDSAAGRLSAYVLDGHMEKFIRSADKSFSIEVKIGGETRTLVFAGVPNPATGETIGDTSLFQAEADWLKTVKSFDGVLKTFSVKGTKFENVAFNFPKGNDKHAH